MNTEKYTNLYLREIKVSGVMGFAVFILDDEKEKYSVEIDIEALRDAINLADKEMRQLEIRG